MQRHVRYATSSDGTTIAYWTLGEGEPLVYMAGGPWNHVELWEVDECRQWYERLARGRMLVGYDIRGTGRSQRNVTDYSIEAHVGDLRAVVDHLGLSRFDLFAATNAGPVALALASADPARVQRLIFWCAWARNVDVSGSPRIQAWLRLLDEDWDLMTETCAHLALGWSAGEVGRIAAEQLRENVSREAIREAFIAAAQHDARHLLREVQAPALVLHRRSIPWLPVEAAHEIASGLPDARLAFFEGESTAPYLAGSREVATAIDAFLSTPSPRRVPADGPKGASIQTSGSEDGLSEREAQVLRLLAGGRTNQEIADELVLSVRTVERHVQNVYAKIGARRRAEATAYALTRGIV